MMGKRMKYTETHLAFLKDGYKRMKLGDLVEAFNDKFGTSCSYTQIRKAVDRYGFQSGRKGGFQGGETLVPFSEEEREFIKSYAHLKNEDIVSLHNRIFKTKRTFCSIATMLWKMGLGKQKQRVLKDGEVISYHKQGYQLIKVPKYKCGRTYRNYKYKHVAVWEEANGPIPEGQCLRFLDGDNSNCEIGNLMLVSRAESARLYDKLGKVAPELRESVVAVVKLETKCAELEEGNN